MEIKYCKECKEALVPTSIGWLCDNKYCEMNYGIGIKYLEDNPQLSDTLTNKIGKVEYRVNDIVVELNTSQTDLQLVTDVIVESGLLISKEVESFSDGLRVSLKHISEENQLLSEELNKIQSKWWYKLFTKWEVKDD